MFSKTRKASLPSGNTTRSAGHSAPTKQHLTSGHRVRQRRHWSRRSRLLLGTLVLVFIADFFLVLFGGLHIYRLRQANKTLRVSLRQSEQELKQIRPEIEKMRLEIEALLQGRFPYFKKFEYDKVLALDDGYLKNIIFTHIHEKGRKGWESKVVMQNHNEVFTVKPAFKLFFFDASGIQIGVVNVGGRRSTPAQKIEPLGPGEIRSHSATLMFSEEFEKPAYFRIKRKPTEIDKMVGTEE